MKAFVSLLLILAIILSGCVTTTPTDTVPQANPPETTQKPPETVPPTQAETVSPTQAVTEPETEPVTHPEPDLCEQLLNSMTIEEKVGQLFLARCPSNAALEDIETYHLGGYILFGRDFKYQTPEGIQQVLGEYQSRARIPMLIAVDEEGGTVNRISCYKAYRDYPFPSPRALYEQAGLKLAVDTEGIKSQLLRELGVNVNMAPVCDITTNPSAFMYKRSLGQSPQITGEFISQAVGIMKQYGVGSVLKHFPGYGNNTHTHTGIAIDNRALDELERVDLVPFQAGIDAGCGAILVSHTFVNCLDSSLPASLSPKVIGYLRTVMGFDGVVVTDDLAMQAITDLYGTGEAAVLAVLAGNDLLCASEYKVQYTAVLDGVSNGRISQERLNEAVLRILRWKLELGLLEN